MPRFFDPLLKLLVHSSERELLAQLQYLKTENRILRSKLPKVVKLSPVERSRLLNFGCVLRWSVLCQLITIVTPRTFARWALAARQCPRGYRKRKSKVGRPPAPEHIHALVIRIARETGLGYTRIQGELKKLGVELARSTITNILKGVGMSPDPRRGEGRWDEFLKMHAESLWACDFFCVRSWTLRGLQQIYAILFIHIKTRQVHVTPVTMHPTSAWVAQQARNFGMMIEDEGLQARYMLRDRDGKFVSGFDTIMKGNGIKPVILPHRSPNLNAHAERVIQSVKHECLNHFVILGERHLDYLLREYVDYYNHCRPHSACDHLPPCRDGPPPEAEGKILCESRLGGLMKHYYRQAA